MNLNFRADKTDRKNLGDTLGQPISMRLPVSPSCPQGLWMRGTRCSPSRSGVIVLSHLVPPPQKPRKVDIHAAAHLSPLCR